MRREENDTRWDVLRTAYHEAGHAVMAWLMEQKVEYASVIPGNGTLGHVNISLGECETLLDYCRDRVMVFLAGDASELMFIEPPPEGFCEPDLWQALWHLETIDILIRGGCDQLGIDDGIGLLKKTETPEFSGDKLHELQDVHRPEFEFFLDEAMDILYEERVLVRVVADALMENDALSGEQISTTIDKAVWNLES